MAKRKKTSKMSAKARMAYVRSFIGKRKGKRGGSLKDQMDYVRSFKGKKKSGGRFPKGTISQWRAKAKSGSASERAKYQRAIANWDKLMGKAGFKEKWNANKKVRGGALEDGVNFRQLLGMYQGRTFGGAVEGKGLGAVVGKGLSGGAVEGKGFGAVVGKGLGGAFHTGPKVFRNWDDRGGRLPARLFGVKGRKYIRGGAVVGKGVKGYGYVPGKGVMTGAVAKEFEKIFDKHMKQRVGLTKKDLYRGAGRQNSLFYTRNRMLKRQRKKPMAIVAPDDEMVQLYRNLYKDSGIHPENMIDPVVRNDRLKGGKFLRAITRPIRKYKVASRVANLIPGPAGKAMRMGARALGAGLIEEAGLNGRGHPPYIYH